MQQHTSLPVCTEKPPFGLGINCTSNLTKLFLHPSNISRHVRKPLTYNQNQNTQGTLNAVKLKYIIFPHTESRIQQSNSGRMKAVLTPIPVSPGLLNLSKFSFISLISFLQAKKKSATHNTMSLIYA